MAEKLYMAALSPTMEKGKIVSWNKKEGDAVKSGDVICEVETDKAVMDYESDFDAYILKIVLPEGSSAEVGEVIAYYGEEGETVEISEQKKPESAKKEAAAENKTEAAVEKTGENKPSTVNNSENNVAADGKRIRISPLAKKIASENGISISTVNGSGTDGRIIKRDIESILEGGSAPAAGNYTAAQDTDKEIPVSGMRSVIARRLAESKFSAPHYYLNVSVDMTALTEAREKINRKLGNKISMNSFIIKIATAALKRHPVINSSWNGDSIIQFGAVNVGFAVALEQGLIAPVIKNTDRMGILEIDSEFRRLVDRAKSGTIKPEEYSGAGFSISNLGGFGIENFTAIINPPGSSILAIGAVIKKPVVVQDDDGEDIVTIKPMMKLSLSCDHRVIDGADGAAFLADIKSMLESPVEALL